MIDISKHSFIERLHYAELFIEEIKSWRHAWYLFGGDDPKGIDCSGLVLEGLKSIGMAQRDTDMTADGLHNMFKDDAVPFPKFGSLCFWGDANGKMYHVAVYEADGLYWGAEGGTSTTTTIEEATKKNAFVKRRSLDSSPNGIYCDIFKLRIVP